MSDRSAIEWTDATWNPVTGCSRVSEGCRNCYAEALSLRMGWSRKPWMARNAAANVVLHPERMDQPLRWSRPRLVFVNSMSDLFHERIPDAYINEVFAVMALAKRHRFQVLTKRPARMLAFMRGPFYQNEWDIPHPPLPNVWLGVSVEDQRVADERIPLLVQVPAAVRFLSVEPLLAPINLSRWIPQERECGRCNVIATAAQEEAAGWNHYSGLHSELHWVIVGGESGPHARPMDPAWARAVRDQCRAAGVPFFFKQWGGRTPKAGGRTLDGRTWDGMPETLAGAVSSP